MAQSSGYGAGPGAVDLSAGVTGGTTGVTGDTGSQGTTDQARERAQEAAGQAKDKAQDVAGQAKEQAQQAAGQAKGALRGQLDQRSTQAGQQISSQASDIRSVSQQLRAQGKEGPAKIADQAADRIERVGGYLSNADADRLLDDVEHFARSNPWAVIAGGLGLGFVAARALKASSVDRYRSGGSTARRQALPRAGATTGGYGTGRYGTGDYGTGEYGTDYGTGTGTGAAVSGGGITGTGGTPVPPATSVPPVTPPATGGVGSPPAGGF